MSYADSRRVRDRHETTPPRLPRRCSPPSPSPVCPACSSDDAKSKVDKAGNKAEEGADKAKTEAKKAKKKAEKAKKAADGQ